MPGRWTGTDPVELALARASLELAEGDEDAAATTLRTALAAHPIDAGPSRRAWRLGLCLPYVLVPETRPAWDAVDLPRHPRPRPGGWPPRSRPCGRDGGCRPAACRDVPVGVVRAALHHCLAADLAIGLGTAGPVGGAALLEAIGPVGRMAVRNRAATAGQAGRSAKALLAAVPAPPPVVTRLAVLARWPSPGTASRSRTSACAASACAPCSPSS